MKIRTAVPGDAAVIADFNLRLAFETEALKLDPETVRKGVAALLADASKGIYFVAEMPGGEVGGQLMITYEWSDWRNGNIWWIQSVYVKQEFRGQGIFKALFDHLERLARQTKGVCALRLYMDNHNQQARRAYQKLGMTETNYQVFEFGIS
jgi:GNAT superfamily N-acetyltransferase